MADIQAFSGIRYDLSKVGSLSDVIAPPYDVIDQELQEELYAKHVNNVVRIILNRGDDLRGDETIYDAASSHFKQWKKDGVLKADNPSAMYVYHQTFKYDGKKHTRRGFMSRVKIEPFGEGKIYPHVETHSKVKEDRFKLMTACQANLSQIFGIYPDQENEIQETLEAGIADKTPLTCTDHLGVEHSLWLVTDTKAISKAAAVMGPKPIYIADGHHRYETATNVRQSNKDAGTLTPEHPSNYVLMMNVSMFDPGMIVLPTHRLFRGIAPISSEEFTGAVKEAFDCEVVGNGPQKAGDVWDVIAVEDAQSTMGFYCHSDQAWVLARLNSGGEKMMEELASKQSDDWRSLGVALLHKLVIGKLLGHESLPSPSYVHSVDEVVEGLTKGDAAGRDATGQQGSGEPFGLCCLVMPATLEHVKRISEHGERMPAKSTYFYPKMLSGLVFNSIE